MERRWIIIKNRKLLLTLGVLFIAFLFTGCFPAINTAPVITTESLPDAIFGTAYTHTIEAVDPEEDTLEFSLLARPTGMTINSNTGVLTWTPAAAGSFDVTVEVSDSNKSTTQSFTITVNNVLLTSIAVLPSNMVLEIGESKTITSVTAHYDNGTEAKITLTACTYVSSKPDIATVGSSGIIKGIDSCTASTAAVITVSYTEDGITRTDTVSVVVTNPSPG